MQTLLTIVATWFLLATVRFAVEMGQPGSHIWQAFFGGCCAFLTVEFTVLAVRRAIRNEHHRKWRELLGDSTDHRL